MKTTTTFLGLLLLAASLLALPMQAQTIRYVKAGATGDGSSWAAASGDLQAIINASNANDQVWVATGTYKPTSGNDRTISFSLKNGVAIYGGFVGNEQTLSARPAINPVSGPGGASQPSSTTLSGDIGTLGNTGDNSYHVLNNSGLTSSAVLDGFVITGGNGTVSGQRQGGGMVNASSSPTLANCSFVGNSTNGDGGGMWNSQSRPSLTNCSFMGNSASNGGGGMWNSQSSPSLTNCSFMGNSASNGGGGMFNNQSSPSLSNCSFQANSASNVGGGIYNYRNSNPVVLTNCSFQANSASEGGVMYNIGSTTSLINCVVFGNGASNTFVNNTSLFTDNSLTVRYSLLETSVNGYTDEGNNQFATTSPFASTTSTQLAGTALAINRGSNDAYAIANGPAIDLAGNPRIFPTGGVIDMGAYEYQLNVNPPITTNNALHFDGQNDQVAIDQGNTPILNGGDAITIEYWFKGTNSQSAVRLQPNDETYIIAAWHNATHILSNDGGTNGLPVGNGFDDGNWHHIAFSWQRNTANGFKSYLDGRLVAQRNSADTPLPVIASGAGLGAYIRNATEYTAGSLDEVRIWTVARTQAQLQASLCSSTTLGLPQTGLVAYYGFDYGVAGGSNADINTLPNLVDGNTNRGLLSNFALSGATSNWVNGVTSSLSSPARLYVKANASGANTGLSWDDAFPDLQSALNYTCSGNLSEIWVAQGTYKPTSGNDRTISFSLKNGVAIYGGFVGSEQTLSARPAINPVTGPGGVSQPSSTTLSGDIGTIGNTGDNSYHVLNNSGLTATARLDGFVITGGNAIDSQTFGGGMYNRSSSPTLTNCLFKSNTASVGGGMYNTTNSNPTLTNCLFKSNTASVGGGMYNTTNSNSTLTNCSFQSNSASNDGGGMVNASSSPTLANCSFVGNSASGFGGGMYNQSSGPILANCSFVGNSASSLGGGMFNTMNSNPSLTNCSFQANSAGQGGGMFNLTSSNPRLTNCVVFGNGASNTFVNSNASSSVTARYSLLEASVTGYGGDNNLTTSTSPFVSTTSTQLAGTAPAINAGSNAAYTSAGGPATDLAGNPRIFPTGGTIDMGAYEYQSSLNPPITTNNALHFDGQNDQVAIDQGNTPILNGGDAITIEYWFKGTNSQSAVRLQPNDETYIIAAWHNATHILSNDGGTNGLPVGNGFDDGNWHHIAFSWQRNTANGFKSYLDGRLVAQRNSADTPLPVIASGAGLGAYIRNATEYTAGSLDEVRIWTVARTQAQLQASLCSSTTLGLPQTGLVAYYGFDYGVAGGSNADINTLPNLVDGNTNRGLLSNFALSGATSNWVNGVTSSLSSPARLYVKANASGANTGLSWDDAFPDLQAALNYACSGNLSEIWVASGTYKPTATTDRSISFMMKAGVAIYGGFVGTEQTLSARPAINPVSGMPSSSTLSGDIGTLGDANDNSYHVIYNGASLSLTSSARLDGFVITGGTALVSGDNGSGGGMFNASSSPTLANCSFVENSAFTGGGMYNQSSSNPVLTNCIFQTNSANADGGGMYNYLNSSPVLTNCSFQGNSAGQGGGMFNHESSNPVLTNCSFVGNSAARGGGMYNRNSSRPSLTNCSFQSNTASQYGGGMYNFQNCSPVLTNCSFQSNTASESGGGMFNFFNSNPDLTNCVLFGNGGSNTFYTDDNGSSVTVRYSLLEGSVSGYGGENNLTTTTSPFASTTSTQLSACSPAINAGSNAAYTALTNPPTTDLGGNPRFFNGGVIDMGAYEFQATPTSLQVSNPAITAATLNQPFSQSFTASGGSPGAPDRPYSFTLASGSLPTGLSLNLNGQLSGSPTQTGSFTLSVSVTDAAGCSGSGAPYVLTVSDATPTITALAANPAAVCVGSPVTFTASIGNVSGSYGYTLTGGSSLITGSASGSVFSQSLTASGSGSQSYTLIINSSGQSSPGQSSPGQSSPGQSSPGQSSPGQSTSASTSLTVNALPMATLSASPSTTLTCAQTSLTLTAGGGSAYAFSPNVVSQSGNTAVVNATGLYSVTVTNGTTGCFSTTSITISQDIAAPMVSITASPSLTITLGQSATLTANVSGGTAPFTYGWSTGSTSSSIVVNMSGPYSVTATGANGCSSSTSVTLSVINTAPVATMNASQTATVGMAFSYLVNAFTDAETPNQLTYTASINPANGFSFDAATRIISGTPSMSGVSSVTVTATDPGSLSASTTFTITVSPAFGSGALSVLHQDVSFGQTTTNTILPYLQLVNSGSAPIPYSAITVRYWLTVEGNSPITNFQNYYVQIGAANVHEQYVPLATPRQGATAYVEYRFDAAAGSLGGGTNSGPIQNGFSKADYSAFNQSDDYSYVANRDYTANPRITAYVNGFLVYGQEPPGTGSVTPLSLMLTASPNVLTTSGTTSLSATVSGGTTPYSYAFSGPGTISPSGNTASVSGIPAGVQTYTVVVRDATSPTSQTISGMVSVTVTQAPTNTAPVATANASQTATVGVPFSYMVNAFTDAETPNQLTYQASINPANGLSFDAATRIISGTPSMSGVSSVSIKATDPGSLSASTTFTITVSPAPIVVTPLALTVTASPNMILTTGTTTLSATVSGGTTPYSYAFTGPGTISPSGNTASVSNLPAGVQTYSVVVRDATSPTSQTISGMVSVTVTQAPTNTAPVATANANQTATVGVPFSYVVNAFTDAETPNQLTYQASINPANGLSFDAATRIISGTPSMSGVSSVSIKATDPGSLSVSTTFTITVNPAPVVAGNAQLSVLHQDVSFGQTTTNTILPYLQLVNSGSAPIAYSTITVRYWLTVEGNSPITNFQNYYVQIGAANVHEQYVPLATPRQGATAYVEYRFDAAAGSLGGGTNSGPIQNGFAKADYSAFNQSDDYSYVTNRDYTANARITAYVNGVLVYGQEPPVGARIGITGKEVLLGVQEPVNSWVARAVGNPISRELVVEIAGAEGQQLELSLIDGAGHGISRHSVVPEAAIHREVFDVSRQGGGLLLLQVTDGVHHQTLKVIKQ